MMERKMKDSGIPWIGLIPEDWRTSKIGELYTNRYERVSDKDFVPLSVTMQGILPQLETAAKTDDGDNRKLVRKGDFAINSRSDRRGSCGISPYDGSVSLINLILAPRNEMNANYYNWLFHTSLFADEFYSWGHGIVADLWTTRWQEMKNIAIPVPVLQEQETIASWLDEKCGEIDELIEVEQKMIVELESYRQAIITETVTRGLNPDAPMRQTGISWIPEIPEHWNKDKVLRLFGLFGSGTTPKGEEWFVDEGGIPWINSGELNFEDLYSTKKSVSPLALSDISALKVYPINSILIAMYGASIGKIAISKIEGCTNQACFVMSKEREDVCLKYVFYQLYSFKERWSELSYGGTQPNINADNIKQTWLALPPVEEQRAIADYLDTKCKEIDELIAVKREKIETLKQYRQSIIFEAVTGKISIK